MERGPTPGLAQGRPVSSIDAPLLRLAAVLGARSGIESVVALGSVARGEEAWGLVEGRRELFSDVELLAITRHRWSPADRRDALRAVHDTAATLGYRAPRFHVDVLFRERRRLGSLPATIFTFELRATGRTVWGRNMLGAVRQVSLANLDFRNSHEILLKRLWHLAEAVPATWLRGAPLPELAARAWGVNLWRNPLDIPTVLLPEAGILLPTYVARVAYWRETADLAPRAALDQALGARSGDWLADCLAKRQGAEAAAWPDQELDRAVRGLGAALAWLLGDRKAAALPPDLTLFGPALIAQSRRIFREQPISPGEGLALARQALAIGRADGPLEAARWLKAPRKGQLAHALLALHQALASGMAEDLATSRAALETALRLGQFVGRTHQPLPGPGRPWTEAWLAARQVVARAFWRNYRLAAPEAWPHLAATIAGARGLL